MNTPTSFLAKIEAIEDVAEDTKRFVLRSEKEDFSFHAGQFALLQVEPKVSRAYSIASAPGSLPRFELLVKYVEGGAATAGHLWKKSLGEKLSFLGPLGHFGALKQEPTKLFCVATGTGLAPIRAILQENFQKQDPLPTTLLFGVRHEKHLFCLEELKSWKTQYPELFDYTLCLSRPEDEADCFTGRVTEAIKEIPSEQIAGSTAFLCGSRPMVQEIKAHLEKEGLTKEQIHQEAW